MNALDTTLVTPELVRAIGEIDEFKGRWETLGNLAPERLWALRRIATVESIGSSTRIEGVRLTDDEIEQLLSGAYQDFVSLGDAVLGAAGFGGKRKVAKGGRAALLDLAQTWCGAREDLADYWVESFMKERKLGTRPVGVGSRQTLTSLSHQAAQEDPAPRHRKQSSPTPPVVKKQKRKLQAPVASASTIALAEKIVPPAARQQDSPDQTAAASATKPRKLKKEGQAKGGSRRMLAIACSALAVAAVDQRM